MKQHAGRDLDLAHALAGVLSGREFGNLKIEVGPKIGYDPKTDTMTLPGIPFGEISEDLKDDLRAYIAHESIGERGLTTWKPSDFPNVTERHIVNGMNDARVDRVALNEWPGAGMAIRTKLQEDWGLFQQAARSGTLSEADPQVLSSALRYIGENVATADEVGALTPALGKLMKKITPALSTVDWDGTEREVIAKAREVYRLSQMPDTQEPAPEDGEGESGEGEGDGEPQDGEGEGKAGESKGKAQVGKASEKPDSESGQGKGQPKGEKGSTGQPEPSKGHPGTPEQGGKQGPKPPPSKPGQEMGGKGASKQPDQAPCKELPNMEQRLLKRLQAELDPMTKLANSGVFTANPSIKRLEPGKGQQVHSSHVRRPSRGMVGRIMRLFRQLQAAEDRVILTGRLLGELDTNKLAEMQRGSQHLFTARKRGETESLAVYISQDLSGSMGGCDEESYRRGEYISKWTKVQPVILGLNEALGRLEIPTAIVGWGGSGIAGTQTQNGYTQPEGTVFADMRGFDDNWKKCEVRIHATNPGMGNAGNNADVTSLADGISQLGRRRESKKLLLYIVDGCPCVGSGEDKLLGKTMKELVERAQRNGILVIALGVGLGPSSRTTMNTIFGKENYVELKGDYEEAIGTQFEKTMKRLITQQEKGMR